MKSIIIAALMLTSSAFAQSITGVAVLKGSLKTKTIVRGTESTCKVKVNSTRNIREEDAYGFPGYRVMLEVNVDGRNAKSEKVVNITRYFTLTNFWEIDGQIVAKDFDYYSTDGANLTIKPDGRLKSFAFNDKNDRITCSF